METVWVVLLCFIEVTLVTFGVLFLHGAKRRIGQISFYLILGVLFAFAQLISVMRLDIILGVERPSYYIGHSILFLPLFAAMLIVYIREGTIVAQKMIIGLFLIFCFYLSLYYITLLEWDWGIFGVSRSISATQHFDYLFGQSTKDIIDAIIAFPIALFFLPVFFQGFRNLGARIFFAILGSLMLAQVFDTIVLLPVAHWGIPPFWLVQFHSSYIIKAVFIIWISVLTTLYLNKTGGEIRGGRKTFDILLALFRDYDDTEHLQDYLVEWEGRYRMMVEYTSDMIFIVDKDGIILDFNPAAQKFLLFSSKNALVGKSFFLFCINLKSRWKRLWDSFEQEEITESLFTRSLSLKPKHKENVEVEISFSKAAIKNKPVLIVICKDLTEHQKLEKKKRSLIEQKYHYQKIDSIRRLVRGIAHEFNNTFYSIQGHIDVIRTFVSSNNKEFLAELDTAMVALDRVHKLIAQLRGFAHDSEYKEESIDLKKMLSETKQIFSPLLKEEIKFDFNFPDTKCTIKGDSLYLQQSFFNLLLNAKDALEQSDKSDKTITVKLEKDFSFPDDWHPLKQDAVASDFYRISIEDNGVGMDDEVRDRVFEPFYTTKEIGEGTGLGLSSVYGEITKHNGFIHVISKKDVGTTFQVYLPQIKNS